MGFFLSLLNTSCEKWARFILLILQEIFPPRSVPEHAEKLWGDFFKVIMALLWFSNVSTLEVINHSWKFHFHQQTRWERNAEVEIEILLCLFWKLQIAVKKKRPSLLIRSQHWFLSGDFYVSRGLLFPWQKDEKKSYPVCHQLSGVHSSPSSFIIGSKKATCLLVWVLAWSLVE